MREVGDEIQLLVCDGWNAPTVSIPEPNITEDSGFSQTKESSPSELKIPQSSASIENFEHSESEIALSNQKEVLESTSNDKEQVDMI